MMADEGLYSFAEKFDVGRQGTASDFRAMPFEQSREEYKHYIHAAHSMIYATDNYTIWNRYPVMGQILMQARFDGNIGFPGGLLDKDATESVVDALNRELEEEIALDMSLLKFEQSDHVISHVNDKNKLVTHFYARECDINAYKTIEKKVLNAEEWGIETFGVIRVPLFIMEDKQRGFPVFLANKFAGNARDQLLLTIKERNILPEDHLRSAISASQAFM